MLGVWGLAYSGLEFAALRAMRPEPGIFGVYLTCFGGPAEFRWKKVVTLRNCEMMRGSIQAWGPRGAEW